MKASIYIFSSFSETWMFIFSICFSIDTVGFHWFYIIYYTEFFISLYSLKKLFLEAILSWLMHESIKALEIRTSIVFNLSFPNSTILSCFAFCYNWLYNCLFLILAVIAQIFVPTEELIIPTETQINEANA